VCNAEYFPRSTSLGGGGGGCVMRVQRRPAEDPSSGAGPGPGGLLSGAAAAAAVDCPEFALEPFLSVLFEAAVPPQHRQ
jgi:hypothetical protein